MLPADQPIYVRNGAINFNRRDEDERDPKIVTYDDYITELKEALIRKDASLDEINLIRQHTTHSPHAKQASRIYSSSVYVRLSWCAESG